MSGQRDRRRYLVRGLALLGGVLLLVLFGGVGGASAHAALTGTDPRDGSVLKTAPRQLTLTFSESVGLLDDSFRVLSPDNRRLHTGRTGHADGRSDTARVTLPRGLGTGTFTVVWRVVSADSHPVSGAFTFSVGKPSETAAALPATENPASKTLYDIARYAAYTGLALLIGATAFTLACGYPGDVRRLLLTGWWTLLTATLALLLLRGPYERGTGPAAAFDPDVLRATLTGRPGAALVVRLVLLGAVAFLPVRAVLRGAAADAPDTGDAGDAGTDGARRPAPGSAPGRERAVVVLGGLLTLGLAVTWAVAEHASAGIQVPAAMLSSVLHLLAMAVWLGGLTALLLALHRPAEHLPRTVVARFSRLALASVAVLAATGLYQSWRGLGSWDALTSTSYGRLLVVKLCAVLLLLAGAAYSRRWTRRWTIAAGQETTAGQRVSAGAKATVPAARVPEPVGGPPLTDTTTAPDAPDGTGAGDGAAVYRRGLRRSVLAEVTVAVLVLVVTTVLTGTQPGRAATETAAATVAADRPTSSTTLVPFDVGTPGGHGEVQIEMSPAGVGENTVQAVVLGPDGGISTVPELRLTFTLAAQKVGPIDAELTDRGGYWGTDGVTLPIAGTWTMKVTVRTTDIDQVTVEKSVKIG
ncbi:copper resistance CopC family protein [Streptomyces sp. 142MFCol3.1]|uniref:copper resistance CopC/CopD family protein n=1 Tax=Streptomyces sp. 142MFCol3.1 TaxID=1172179 RepID=UPI00041460AC|nr:copper resistance CopC family protein [Streptomyces sp. 142MFCol3.1]